jgi:hypothetical protein
MEHAIRLDRQERSVRIGVNDPIFIRGVRLQAVDNDLARLSCPQVERPSAARQNLSLKTIGDANPGSVIQENACDDGAVCGAPEDHVAWILRNVGKEDTTRVIPRSSSLPLSLSGCGHGARANIA